MIKSLKYLFSTVSLLSFAAASFAQQPSVPPLIRIVVPFAAGASNDLIARAVAKQLAPRLGTTVIVENKPGASTMIGAETVAKGPRDGSMLLVTSMSTFTSAATLKSTPIDVNADLTPVSIIAEGPLTVIASTKTSYHTLADLFAAARANPDGVTYASAGTGGVTHLAPELMNDAAKIKTRHIPYKSGAPAVLDLAGGFVDFMIAGNGSFTAQIAAGRMRLIGVTSREPHPSFPGVPTVASVLPGFEVNQWNAVFAPPGTPVAIIQRYNREINEISRSKEMLEFMAGDGSNPISLTPEETTRRVRQSYITWKKLASDKQIVVE